MPVVSILYKPFKPKKFFFLQRNWYNYFAKIVMVWYRSGKTFLSFLHASVIRESKVCVGRLIILWWRHVKEFALNLLTLCPFSLMQFRWFYHMYDDHNDGMGKLNIVYHDLLNLTMRTIWTKEGNQGDKWNYGTVTFDVDSFLYQVSDDSL